MKHKLLVIWGSLRTSFWFVPALMVLGAMALVYGLTSLDAWLQPAQLAGISWIYTGSPEGARSMLSTIAGSMLTVAGLSFSITIAALTLASTQFGPRLLRNFIRDTGNQVVLGTFIAGYIYCLLVLRTVRGGEDNPFVPQISVTFGVGMALAGVGVLIYFIHHIAQSIQAAHLIAMVGEELDHAVDHLFPERIGHEEPKGERPALDAQLPQHFEHDAIQVPSKNTGYLQTVDDNRLLAAAVDEDVVVRLIHRPGDWVVAGSPLVEIWPPHRGDDSELVQRIVDVFVFGIQRTETQDVEFPMRQLVEIAVRALSPGINDPHTAIMCIDRLGASLVRLSDRTFPSPYRYDDAGQLRVIASPLAWSDIMDTAFNEIRQYGQSSAVVTLRLLGTIAYIAQHVTEAEEGAALLHHARMIERGSREGLPEEHDRKEVHERYEDVLGVLKGGLTGSLVNT